MEWKSRDHITSEVLQRPLIGRDKEMAYVLDTIEEGFLEKVPTVVFIKGPPLSGKTHFLMEIEFRLGIVKNITTIRITPESSYSEVVKEVGSLSTRTPNNEFLSVITDELSRVALAAAKHTPLIILIDDLERTDTRFRDFIEFIVNLKFKASLAVISTCNFDNEFVNMLENQKRGNRNISIKLHPFTRAQTRAYVRQHLKIKGMDKKSLLPIAEKIHNYTGGLPGLVAVLVDVVNREDIGEDLSEIERSPDVWAVVKSILDYFGEEELEVILTASIYGDEFDERELSMILQFKQDFIHDTLEKAVELGIVSRNRRKYRFEAELYKTWLLNKFDHNKVQALHRKIAIVWENETRDPELLAMHYFEGGLYVEAARYLLTIAESYVRNLKFDHAENVLRTAVEAAIRGNDPITEFETRYALIELYRSSYNLDKLEKELSDLTRLAEKLDIERYKLLAKLSRANYLFIKDETKKSLELAFACLKSGDVLIKERALELIIASLLEQGNYDKAEKYIKMLHKLGAQLKNDLIKAQASFFLAKLHLERKDFFKAAQLFNEVIGVFSGHDMWRQVLMSIFNLISIYLQTKRLAQAYDLIDRGLNLVESFDADTFKGLLEVLYAEFLMEVGQYREAINYATENLERLERHQQVHLYISAVILLAHLYTIRNNFKKAFEYFNKANTLLSQLENPNHLSIEYPHYLAMTYWKSGNIRRAEELLNEAYELASQMGAYDQLVLVGQDLALFYVETGHRNKGKDVAQKGIKLAQKYKMAKSKFYYALFLLAKIQDEEDEARNYIENAYGDLVVQSLGLENKAPELWRSFFENVEINRRIRREWLKYNPEGSSSVLL